MTDNRVALWASRVILAAAACVALVSVYKLRAYRLDDALIYARYVRNFYAGEGLVYTPGQLHNGVTSPLYIWVLIAVTALVSDAAAAGVYLGGFCLLLTVYVAARHVFPKEHSPLVGAVAALAIATTGLNYSTLGMESSLVMLLATITLATYRTGSEAWFGFVVGLLGIARAEMVFLALPLFIAAWRSTGRIPWRAAVVAFATMVPAFAYNAIAYGAVLPDTLTAKIQQGRSGFWGEHYVFLGGMLDIVNIFHVGLFKTLVAAALSTLCFLEKPRPYPFTVVASFVLLLIGFYSAATIPAYHWYLVPIVWALCLLAPLGVSSALRLVARRFALAVPLMTALAGACAAYLIPANYQKVEELAGQPHLAYQHIGTWLHDNAPPGSWVGAAEVGHLGWYSNLPIVDLCGLVTPGTAQFLAQRDVDSWLKVHRTDYLVTHVPSWPLEQGAQHALDRREFEVETRVAEPGFQLLVRVKPTPIQSGSLLGTLAHGDELIREDTFTIDKLQKRGLFMHPITQRSFQFDDHAAHTLRAALGVATPDDGSAGDGASFVVLVRKKNEAEREVLRRHIAPGHWEQVEVDLGDADWLSLRTEPGPANDSRWDWAVWGEPEVVARPLRHGVDAAARR